MPAPEACKIRPTNNNEKFGEIAAINVPIVNNPIAVINNLRVVNLSIKKAVTGIIIPFTSIKTDCSHCAVLSLKFKSFMMGGSAVPSSYTLFPKKQKV
ncbi:hypothetical protein J18TS1_36820 [Oceanobacillus oncorhynchi subsp. incaldanensis]|nr:hypothetical protein J18TS1_36820 [Oceanobacillus oncorhynchi subsp. incaldanensis]